MARVEFLFDFGSPNAYLCHRVIPEIEARTGAEFVYEPILLGGVFKATGNVSPAISLQGVPNKQAYQRVEMERFLRRHRIGDFNHNPFFPVNTLNLMRGAVAAQFEGVFEPYVEAIYSHMWREPKKLDDPEVWREALLMSALDADLLMTRSREPNVKAKLIASTERAVARGAFGSPTFFVGDDMFFGKDQLRDVEDAVLQHGKAWAPMGGQDRPTPV